MYQIEGREVLFAWLRGEQDARRQLAMLDFLVGFIRDPWANAYRVPGVAAPVCLVVAPLKPRAVLKVLIADQFHTVRIIEISNLA